MTCAASEYASSRRFESGFYNCVRNIRARACCNRSALPHNLQQTFFLWIRCRIVELRPDLIKRQWQHALHFMSYFSDIEKPLKYQLLKFYKFILNSLSYECWWWRAMITRDSNLLKPWWRMCVPFFYGCGSHLQTK